MYYLFSYSSWCIQIQLFDPKIVYYVIMFLYLVLNPSIDSISHTTLALNTMELPVAFFKALYKYWKNFMSSLSFFKHSLSQYTKRDNLNGSGWLILSITVGATLKKLQSSTLSSSHEYDSYISPCTMTALTS